MKNEKEKLIPLKEHDCIRDYKHLLKEPINVNRSPKEIQESQIFTYGL